MQTKFKLIYALECQIPLSNLDKNFYNKSSNYADVWLYIQPQLKNRIFDV